MRIWWMMTLGALAIAGGREPAARPAGGQEPAARPAGGQEPAAPSPLEDRLSALRDANHLPAIAAVTFRSSGPVARAAVGVRRAGDDTAVTLDDLWHIGSVTKSFTSALVARLVERGDLAWTTTLGELAGASRAGAYAPVTVAQLLAHRAGLPANVPQVTAVAIVRSGEPVSAQRQRIVDLAFQAPPNGAPGEVYLYSNVGYIVMGALLETRTGQSWESLVRAEVLEPLGLSSAGFGPPGEAGVLTQPRGHRAGAGGVLTPVEPGPGADNPAYLGPAGTLHMTIDDLARWGQRHLAGERGEDTPWLRAATLRRLHELPPGGDYALGWVVRRAGGRRIVWHNGSNTMWYAVVAFDPDADTGVAIATNGSIGAQAAIDAALPALLDAR
ncbi:MAG: serine hydrolase domain-containing protein [Vicinamibacterales bacterium]